MADRFTVVGSIGTDLETRTTSKGDPYLRFRVASTDRWRDENGGWVDGSTSWYDVEAYGALGRNASTSLAKGQRVVVFGDIAVREYTTEDGRRGRAVRIRASAIGPDLTFGTAVFSRATRSAPSAQPSPPRAEAPAPEPSPVDRSGDWPGAMAPAPALVGAGEETPF